MFLIIPTGVDYQTRRYPTVTFTLMGINIAVYLLTLFFWFQDFNRDAENSMEIWFIENFWLIPEKSTWYTYLTSMFVHADFWHLLGNMIYLFLFGSCVEDTIGRWKFIALYFLGGFISEFAHIAFEAGHFASEIPLGGASGAISACMGAFLILLPKRKIEFKWLLFIFLRFFNGEFSLPSWLVMSFWFLQDLFFAVLSTAGYQDGTAFGAHVGGFVAGMGLAFGAKALLGLESRSPTAAEGLSGYQSNEPATIYVFENGSQVGPFTHSQVLQMRTLGSFGQEAVYWQEGMADWQSVNDI